MFYGYFKILVQNKDSHYSSRLSIMKNVLLAKEKDLTFWNGIFPYSERPEEAILIASRIQRKINGIKQDKDVLLYYFKGEIF